MSLEVKKRKNTWTYVLDIGIDPLTGNRKRKSKGGFKTKGECRTAASKIITELNNGSFFEVVDITLENFLEKYFDTVKQNLAPKTFVNYKCIANYHLIPKIGKMKLKQIKPLHIQDVYNAILKTNSSTTARHVHSFLHKALNLAVKWRLIVNNPSEDVEKPKRAKTEMHVLNENQLNLFLKSLETFTIFLVSFIAATTGMREAEICGLTWENVNIENRTLYVKSQLQRIDKELKLVPLKTNNSRRSIQLPNILINTLEDVKISQEENKKYFGDAYDNRGFVYAQPDGRPYDPGYISRNFIRVVREYKYKCQNENGEHLEKTLIEMLSIPKIRFHDIRHTHSTLLLKRGISVKVVAERLGDTVDTVLHTYAHVLPDMQKEAAEKLDEIFD
ncbi:MAG TPA: site-specific integrase [Clostridiaceae bacterium]